MVHLSVCLYYVTYAFQNKSTLYIGLNVTEFLAKNRRDIGSLSDCNGTRIHNDLVRRGTLNHLAKLKEWVSWIVSTDLYGAFDCMFLSCHVRVSEWIHTLSLPACQGTSCSKEAWYLKFKRLQDRVWIQSETRTYVEDTVKCIVQISTHNSVQSFGLLGQMVERSFAN